MKKVIVFLAEGFEETEALSVIDILRRAEIPVTSVSVEKDKMVKGAHDVPVQADMLFDDVDFDKYDMIVMPGGMPGAKNLKEHEGVRKQVTAFVKDKQVGAICAAPMVLGSLGLLDGKRVTCYPGFEPELIGATVTGEAVTVDGNIITGKGPALAMKFSLQIVETLAGKAMRDEVSNALLM